jgi:hypothetical protein
VLSIAQRDPTIDPYSFGEDELPALEDVFRPFVGSLCAALFPKPAKEHDTEPLPVPVLHEAEKKRSVGMGKGRMLARFPLTRKRQA